nr:MAG TPA: tail completion protein [Caudoviricetes sp.]
MIKLSEILKAVNSTLNKACPDVTIDSKDLSESFNRPSFRTELDGLKTSAFMTTFKERRFTIRIYFFNTVIGKGKEERLKVIEAIEDAFLGSVKVNDTFIIPIDDIEFNETDDGVLIASFDSLTMEEITNDVDSKMMEELEYRF